MLTNRYTPITIYQRINTESFSETSPTWQIVSGNYTGFIQLVSSTEKIQDGRKGEQATHRLYTGLNTPAVYGYKIIQGNENYIMLSSKQTGGVSNTGHHQEIILSEVR